ncbi:uncharacterized protein LY89DRAFT_253214 [Mollisia scopiformis]|uniref:Uncharacterized protein n=1 Tax=Mollisia scopiformis TaxID=149040 RepID=A0A194WSP4_MOLSC|nr:uncharacterized protein LY89DRAFT_253214 [Mollisia scopiformis]KUJ10966.1 hypothetical protein LY89DRAFT_253214 [Mollisia scopiformis]
MLTWTHTRHILLIRCRRYLRLQRCGGSGSQDHHRKQKHTRTDRHRYHVKKRTTTDCDTSGKGKVNMRYDHPLRVLPTPPLPGVERVKAFLKCRRLRKCRVTCAELSNLELTDRGKRRKYCFPVSFAHETGIPGCKSGNNAEPCQQRVQGVTLRRKDATCLSLHIR